MGEVVEYIKAGELSQGDERELGQIVKRVEKTYEAMQRVDVEARIKMGEELARAQEILLGPVDTRVSTKIGESTPFTAWVQEQQELGYLTISMDDVRKSIQVYEFVDKYLNDSQRKTLVSLGGYAAKKLSTKKWRTGGQSNEEDPERIKAITDFIDEIGKEDTIPSNRNLELRFHNHMASRELTPYKPPPPKMEAMTIQEAEEKIEKFLADIHDHFKGRSAKRTELRRQLKEFIIAEVQSW